MKNFKFPFLIAVCTVFNVWALPNQDPYFVKMKNLKFDSFSFKEIKLSSEAVFYNTYKAKAKLTEVFVDVYIENKLVGNVTQIKEVDIPKLSAFDIPINLSANTSKTLGTAFWQSGRLVFGKEVEVKFSGYIKIKALNFVPLKIPIESSEIYSLKDII
jgi:hypothetical protein